MEMKRKVLELKEYKSYRAMGAFQRIILGLQLVPGFRHFGFEDLCNLIEQMSFEDQLKTITQAARVVTLEPEEFEAILCFCTDKNGIPYTKENKKNLTPSEIMEIIITVCMHLIKEIKIDLVSIEEKKN